eukprot:255008-Pyramimonas_sp.AAC.1
MNSRGRFWVRWWEGIGHQATVVKVKAHRARSSATSLGDDWLILGNQMADRWAKKGAPRWSAPLTAVCLCTGGRGHGPRCVEMTCEGPTVVG